MSSNSSEVSIANRALLKLGATRINSFDEDSVAASSINAIYQSIRDTECRAYVWRFLLARAELPALDSTPDFGYSYQYQEPTDCLRLIQVGEYYVANLNNYVVKSDASFSLEGNLILTNIAAPLKIRYLRRVTDTTVFDPNFVEMLACKLATELCEIVTNSASKRQLLTAEYKEARQTALRSNSLEVASESLPDNSWVLSRLPGSY